LKRFVDLTLEDQASIVLLSLLEDVANEKRTMAGIEHHVHQLYDILRDHFDVPSQEVDTVVVAVAKRGVEMLPGYVIGEEDGSGTDGTTSGD